jgi:alpha-beta hydrolase superfamily lysophospholipase
MPFNLAVLDMNAADGIRELYPEIDHWYIGGHSLGGSIAASYAAKNSEDFDGVILLASYSTTDISATTLDVLSIYGSEDNVMNREKYEKYKKNLPTDLIEIVIDGGCHAYFGMYGEQEGDGTPTLSAEEQIRVSADYISDFVLKGKN